MMIINRSRLPIKHILTIGLLPSVLKVGYYRRRGARIGKGVKIGIGAVILSNDIEIGSGTTIGMLAMITCAKLRIGKRTLIRPLVLIDALEISIGNDVTISEVTIIRALIPSKQSKIILHDRVHVFPFTVIDQLKNISQIEHSRHRSVTNFMVNLLCGLIAYAHPPKKPSLGRETFACLPA